MSYATAAVVIFGVPELTHAILYPPLMLLAERLRRHRKALVVSGLAMMGLGLVLAGLAPGMVTFTAACSLAWLSSSLGVELSRATLMDAEPERREQIMARWALLGTLGDLATPLTLAALGAVALGWRAAFWLAGGLLVAQAALLATRRFPGQEEDDDEDEPPLREALAAALRNPRLMLWLSGATLCQLLDEPFVAFAGLFLEERFGAGLAERSMMLAGMTTGGLVGLAWTERRLGQGAAPIALMAKAAVACAAALALWLAAPSLGWSAAGLVALGTFAAPLWPIAHAQAVRALPGRAGLVEAVASLLSPVEMFMPIVMGVVADRVGLAATLTLTALQPLGLLAIAAWSRRHLDTSDDVN